MSETLFTLTAISFSAAVFFVLLFLWINRRRDQQDYIFELTPNCLLTRYPVVFVTGPRSLFYFRRYWNSFPAFLAEHGYEVFTLALPWKGKERLEKMNSYLAEQEKGGHRYHFILDSRTAEELSPLLRNSSVVLSQTIPSTLFGNAAASIGLASGAGAVMNASARADLLTRFSYRLHCFVGPLSPWAAGSANSLSHAQTSNGSTQQVKVVSLAELGACFPFGASPLLQRMQELGEEDFLR